MGQANRKGTYMERSRAAEIAQQGIRAAKEALFGVKREEKRANIERARLLLDRARTAQDALGDKVQSGTPAIVSAATVLRDAAAKVVAIIEADQSSRDRMGRAVGGESLFTAIPEWMLAEMEETMAEVERGLGKPVAQG